MSDVEEEGEIDQGLKMVEEEKPANLPLNLLGQPIVIMSPEGLGQIASHGGGRDVRALMPPAAPIAKASPVKAKKKRISWAFDRPAVDLIQHHVDQSNGSKRAKYVEACFQDGLAKGLWNQDDKDRVLHKYGNLCKMK